MKSTRILALLLLLPNTALAELGAQKLLVASYRNDNVLAFDAQTGAPLGAFVQPGAGGLSHAGEIVFGPDHDLYVVNLGGNDILRFNGTSGAFISAYSNASLQGPGGIAFDGSGLMYVTSFDNHAVVRFNPSSGAFLGVFATASNSPGGITFGPDGNLYTTVSVANRVERFDGVTGAPLGAFTSGHLFDPCPLIFGPNGDLFVHSQDDYKIVEFNGATGAFVRNFVAESYPFNPSSEIAFGPDGNLYTGNLTAGAINDGVRRYNGTTGAFIDNFVPGDGTFWSTGLAFTPVPEPSSVVLVLVALGGLIPCALWQRRQRMTRRIAVSHPLQ